MSNHRRRGSIFHGFGRFRRWYRCSDESDNGKKCISLPRMLKFNQGSSTAGRRDHANKLTVTASLKTEQQAPSTTTQKTRTRHAR
ncbi:hypothetical protein AAMO2058_001195300 [Amorphochlora amoebiformis]